MKLSRLLFMALVGAAWAKFGRPQVSAFPSSDGNLVLKVTLTRTPGFVAYVNTGRARQVADRISRQAEDVIAAARSTVQR